MDATRSICLFLLSTAVFIQAQCSEKIDFKSVFHTPPRRYDDFEILERSSFEPDDFLGAKEAARCITEKPKAIANAQVLVNFDSHKRTKNGECDRLKQHPFVYLLPQVHHDAPYSPPHPVQVMEYTHHYHTPQYLQYPSCCYPNPCAAHVLPVPYPNVPAKVSKSCIFNVKHEFQTVVDPNEMYGLAVPYESEFVVQPAENAVEEVQKVTPVDMGDVQVPKVIAEACECKLPSKYDEELILVGLAEPKIEGFRKVHDVPTKDDEELILVGLAKPTDAASKIEGFRKVHDVPTKDDEELILVGFTKPTVEPSKIEGFRKVHDVPTKDDEEFILVGSAKSTDAPSKIEGFRKVHDVPTKDDEELILVGLAKPTVEPSKIEGFRNVHDVPAKDDEEFIFVDSTKPTVKPSKIECFRKVHDVPTKDDEEVISVGSAKPADAPSKIEGFQKIPDVPNKGDEQFILVGTAEPVEQHEDISKIEKLEEIPREEVILVEPSSKIEGFVEIPGKEDEEFILVGPAEPSPKIEGFKSIPNPPIPIPTEKHEEVPSKIEGFAKVPHPFPLPCEIQPVAKKIPVSEESRRRIFCTVENLVNHLVHDDVCGIQPCEKLRIAEVLTQVLINLKTKGEPSTVNEESLRVFFGFIKKVQDEYSGVKVECRAGLPTPSLPFEETANPATLLTELQTRLRDVEENPNKDEDFANQYSLLLLSYLKTLQKEKDELKPQEAIAVTEPPKETKEQIKKEQIKKEILEEIELPLLNQYVDQLNSDREKEKPLTNEDVLNLWVDSASKVPREKKTIPSGENKKQSPHEDVPKPSEIPREEKKDAKEEKELQEEISAYKHILESKPVEDKATPKPEEQVSNKKEEIIPSKPSPKSEPEPVKAKQEDPKDLALLLKYLHLLSTNIAPVGAKTPEVKPKEVDTSLLRPFIQVEKGEEIQSADKNAPQIIKVVVNEEKQEDEIIKVDDLNVSEVKKVEGPLKITEQKEEFIRVDDITKSNVPPVNHQQFVEVTKLYQEQPEDIMKIKDDVVIKQTQPQNKIIRIDDVLKAENANDVYVAKLDQKQPEDIMKIKDDVVIKQTQPQDKIIRIIPPTKLKKDEDIGAYKEIKEHRQEIIRSNQIIKETEAVKKQQEEIIKVDDAIKQGEIIKVDDNAKLGELNSLLLELKKEENVKGAEEIIEHHSKPVEEIIKLQPLLKLKKNERQEEVGSDDIIKANEEVIKDKGHEEIINANEECIDEVVKVGQDLAIPKTDAGELEVIAAIEEIENGAKEEFLNVKKEQGGNHQAFIKIEKPEAEQFEQIGEANEEEEDIIEIEKAAGEKENVQLIAAGSKEEEEVHKHIDEGQNLPSLSEYLEFLKTEQPLEELSPTPSGKYIEFTKANRKSGKHFDLKTLNLCVPVLGEYIEFMKTKRGKINPKGLGVCLPFIADYIEFAKTNGEKKYIEFVKAKELEVAEEIQESPRKYFSFKEEPSLNAYVEFVKAKQGNLKDLSLAEYIEFMKAKEHIEFVKSKGKEDYLSFKEVPSSDKYVEFMKDRTQPEYLEFTKEKQEKVTEPECEVNPEKYLNFKYLSVNAPLLNKYVEFIKSKNSGKDLSPTEYVEFTKVLPKSYLNFKKLPFLDEYVEFIKAKDLSFNPLGYVEFVKAKTPENYLNFMKSFSPGEYVEFMGASKLNLSLPEYVEFLKAKQCPPLLDDYVKFMKADKGELESLPNLKDLTLEDIGHMWKVMENLERIKLKLDDLEKVKSCRCEPSLGKLETPSGYEILTPNSFRYYQGERDSPRRIFPHDIDDLSKQKRGTSPNIFDLILPEGLGYIEQNIVPVLHPQMATSSKTGDVNTSSCACGRTLENGRCPSCAPYVKEFNE